MLNDNPFSVNAYRSPLLFCDREEETATITSALRNGRDVMLYSPRRYGKTGLIHHVFNALAKVRGARMVFADIYAAHDAHEFNTILLNAVHEALNPWPWPSWPQPYHQEYSGAVLRYAPHALADAVLKGGGRRNYRLGNSISSGSDR